jgi:serine protease Do
MKYILHKIIPVLALACCILQENTLFSAATLSSVSQISNDFTAVAKKAIPPVVSIKVKSVEEKNQSISDDSMDSFGDDFLRQFFFGIPRQNTPPQPTLGQASGFLVSPEGYILTNAHVVNNATEITVTLTDGREFAGKIIGQDPSTDVAVIKIDGEKLPFLELADSEDLEVGQWAIAVGNPLGLQASLTVGVVSAKSRNNLDLANVEDFIQTDAAINRGNSGGPLLDIQGNVLGMNTAIVSNAGTGGYMGIGFAIPSNILKNVMDQIIQTGSVERGFMGVILQGIDKDLAQAFGVPQGKGALIAEVSKGSPAEKAGIKQGDIIQNYNKIPVQNIGALRNAVALLKPGTPITLTILREGKSMDISVEIGSYPRSTPKAASLSGNQLGFEVQDLTPETAKTLGIKEEAGVVITKVEPGSVAAWAGLKKGTLILSINQAKVSDVNQFHTALENLPPGKPVILLVKQGDITRFLSLKVN